MNSDILGAVRTTAPTTAPSPRVWSDFQGESRSNSMHESKTEPEAKLLKKSPGAAAKVCFGAHDVMVPGSVSDDKGKHPKLRNGLCVLMDVQAAVGEGCAEDEVAERQLDELLMLGFNVKTVGTDKGYHNLRFVQGCRDREIAPHVARIEGRKTPDQDGRTTRERAYRSAKKPRQKRVKSP